MTLIWKIMVMNVSVHVMTVSGIDYSIPQEKDMGSFSMSKMRLGKHKI